MIARPERRGPVAWAELCRDPDFKGRWVALKSVRYESGVPVEGEIVDADADLAALCTRIQAAEEEASCAILLCDDKASGIRRAASAA
jgi:hypothetical protein